MLSEIVNNTAEALHPGAMPFKAGQASLFCPPPIPIHNNGYMGWHRDGHQAPFLKIPVQGPQKVEDFLGCLNLHNLGFFILPQAVCLFYKAISELLQLF